MNHNLLQFKPFSLVCTDITVIIILFFSVETALSIDPKFEACGPRNCGNFTNISYPFWTYGQESYCGHPEFGLSCQGDDAVLQISDYDYKILDIHYDTLSVLVANVDLFEDVCPPVQNLTLDGTPFIISRANMILTFFLNCTSLYPGNSTNFQISCLGNESHHSFSMFGYWLVSGHQEYINFAKTCVSSVVMPVAEDRVATAINMSSGNYSEFLRKGFLLEWPANNCSRCEGSGGRCGYDVTIPGFVCFCSDQPYPETCSGSRKADVPKKVIIGVSTGVGIFLTACLLFFCCRSSSSVSYCGKCIPHNLLILGKKKDNCNVESFLNDYGTLAPKRYKYSDLKKMTKSFTEKLGQGGYGDVFKGELPDGRSVAVKVLMESKGTGEEFVNEVASIGRTSHVNVVTLLGFCSEGPKNALIYEFMPNGSLEKFIYNDKSTTTSPLGWEKLYQIAIGIARGLEYLHCRCNTRILHFDIKPHNILLDRDFCPKISDFGLAKLCPSRESAVSMLDARGTVGYTAPELFCRNIGKVSHKSDVYSYGMMVLEMVGGRKNIDPWVENTSEIYFPHWIYNRLDLHEDFELSGVTTGAEEEIARKMIIVGLWCIQTDPATRPSMTKVVEMLEGSLEGLQMPPKPFLSSPSRS